MDVEIKIFEEIKQKVGENNEMRFESDIFFNTMKMILMKQVKGVRLKYIYIKSEIIPPYKSLTIYKQVQLLINN